MSFPRLSKNSCHFRVWLCSYWHLVFQEPIPQLLLTGRFGCKMTFWHHSNHTSVHSAWPNCIPGCKHKDSSPGSPEQPHTAPSFPPPQLRLRLREHVHRDHITYRRNFTQGLSSFHLKFSLCPKRCPDKEKQSVNSGCLVQQLSSISYG